MIEGPDNIKRQNIKSRVRALLVARNYEQLERLAADYRRTRASFADGEWLLQSFYLGLSQVPDTAADAVWETRIAQLKAWAQRTPQSVTPLVALAYAYFYYAYHARGHGDYTTVTPAMQRLMRGRARIAAGILADSAALRRQCPGWYAVAQYLGRLQPWPRPQYDQTVDEGIQVFPQYAGFHKERILYLLPRWYGRQGEWEAYAEKVCDEKAGAAGDLLYAQLCWHFQEQRYFVNIFRETRLSWPRVKAGYKALLKRNPGSLEVASAFAQAAVQAGDKATQRSLFHNQIKNTALRDVWESEGYFKLVQYWALGQDVKPRRNSRD